MTHSQLIVWLILITSLRSLVGSPQFLAALATSLVEAWRGGLLLVTGGSMALAKARWAKKKPMEWLKMVSRWLMMGNSDGKQVVNVG